MAAFPIRSGRECPALLVGVWKIRGRSGKGSRGGGPTRSRSVYPWVEVPVGFRGRVRSEPRWGCVDLREWAAVVAALPCWTEEQREAMGGYTLRVLEYPRAPRSAAHGLCEYDARVITVSVWPGQRGSEVVETLLHELVHAAGYRDHGAEFRRVLLGAAREMTGVEVPPGPTMWDEWFGVQRALRGRYAELGAWVE